MESDVPNGRVRWGVISTANIGRAAVNPAIQASSNGALVAVASRDGDRAKAFAAVHSIAKAYGSYQALLEDDEIDAVYIPLPNSEHREWTIRAVEHGKHVLCEKPLALDASECAEMGAAAAQHGVTLMEAFMYRFHPRTERVIEMIREGRIGTLKAIRSSFTFRLTNPANIRLDPELGGGALMDVGCYCVNVSRTMAGEEPEAVQATAQWTDRGVDDFLAGTLHFPSGAVAHFDCALTMARYESYEVAGTDGYLRVPASFLPGTGDVEIEDVHGDKGTTTHVLEGADEYRLMVEHFAECVLHGNEPRYGAGEAAANMRVIEALYRSARGGGQPVSL
jgi:predicted dehydrogenase